MLSAVFTSGLHPGWQRGLSSESRHFVNIVWLPAMIRLHSGKPDVLLDSLIQRLPYQWLLIWGRLARGQLGEHLRRRLCSLRKGTVASNLT